MAQVGSIPILLVELQDFVTTVKQRFQHQFSCATETRLPIQCQDQAVERLGMALFDRDTNVVPA